MLSSSIIIIGFLGAINSSLLWYGQNHKDAFFIFQVEVAKGFFEALKDNLGDLKKTVELNKEVIADFGNTIGRGLSVAINGTVKVIKFLNGLSFIDVT